MSKTAVIISSYPTNYLSNSLLGLTIESWSQQNYDICLTTHSPINKEIQEGVKYFIYTNENERLTFPKPSWLTWFLKTNDLIYQTNWLNKMGTHSFAILQNLKNGLNLLKNKGYTDFIFIDDDTFLTQSEHDVFKSNYDQFLDLDSWFFIEWQVDNTTLLVSTLFGGKIDYFLDKLNQINTQQDYLNACEGSNGYSLENFLGNVFYNQGNSYFEPNSLRQLFKNEWLGSSSSNNVHVPGLNKKLFWPDLVKDRNDPNSIYAILSPSDYGDYEIEVKIYKNDNLLRTDKVNHSNTLRYWGFDDKENNKWKIEIWDSGKLFKQVEATTSEIKNNEPAYITFI